MASAHESECPACREAAHAADIVMSCKAVDAFGLAWARTPAGAYGARRRAGLKAVAALLTHTDTSRTNAT